jgi:hypothetical protein
MKFAEIAGTIKEMRKSPAIYKDGAGWLQKFSVGAIIVALFQAETLLAGLCGTIVAGIAQCISFQLILKAEKEDK